MKVYKIIDPTEPRFRISKYRHIVINRTLWERYNEESEQKIDYETFKKIGEEISKEIVNIAISERDGVVLPERMGRIWLGLFKTKNPFSDKEVLRNHGLDVKRFSFETNGFQGKIVWDFNNIRYKFRDHEFYSFEAHRSFKTISSHNFKNNPELFVRKDLSKSEKGKRQKLEQDELNRRGSNKSDQDTNEGS